MEYAPLEIIKVWIIIIKIRYNSIIATMISVKVTQVLRFMWE